MKEDRHICCERVSHGKGWNRWDEACGRTASVERNGKWYCKIHDPVRRSEMKAKREAEWNARWAEEQARARVRAAAPAMLAALQALLAWPGHDQIPQDILAQSRAAVDATIERAAKEPDDE
ncbi:MAG: hypothetical protein E7022_03575 [Desulfovibrio desulfuricans]|nr:hypothetical protein [Desulfovibrio desulfuricans]